MHDKKLVAPSMLAADLAIEARDIDMVNRSDADWFHFDVMDGVFCAKYLFFACSILKPWQNTSKTLDVHLMIVDPDRYIQTFADLGADVLTVYIEACTHHTQETPQSIKAAGMKAGVALNPHTHVSDLSYTIHDIDLVCLMSVNPGFGGQSFIETTYQKVRELHALIDANDVKKNTHRNRWGVTDPNATQLIDAGAMFLVAGSYIFCYRPFINDC